MTIDRLRDAARAVGETIGDVPPLELGTRTKRAWIVPIAAAASVAVAVAAGMTIARGGNGISQVVASTAGPVAPPKFLASVDGNGITVQTVANATTTATVPQPSTQERFTLLQAAQDNRLFYAATDSDDCHPRFYQFTLDENGQVTGFGVRPFGPAEGTRAVSMAVSGDGRKLAYGAMSCKPGEAASKLVVTDTETGDSRTWTSKDYGVPADLSLSADGSRAAFRLAPTLWRVAGEASPVPMPSEVASPIVTKTVTIAPSATPDETLLKLEEEKKRVMASEGPAIKDGIVLPMLAKGPCALAGVVVAGEKTGVVVSKAKPRDPRPLPSDIPPGLPSDLPSPLPSDLPSNLPSDLPPSLSSGPPSAQASAAPSGAGTAYDSSLTISEVKGCEGGSDVRILDTGGAGDSLDGIGKVTLPTASDGVSGGVMGIRLSPDGSRLIGSLGAFSVRIADDKVTYDGSAALVAFDAADGKPVETLFKDADKGGLVLIDLDGSGQSALVQRMNE